jgi:hypothetical protein
MGHKRVVGRAAHATQGTQARTYTRTHARELITSKRERQRGHLQTHWRSKRTRRISTGTQVKQQHTHLAERQQQQQQQEEGTRVQY